MFRARREQIVVVSGGVGKDASRRAGRVLDESRDLDVVGGSREDAGAARLVF